MKKAEIFRATYGNLFDLFLTVEFTEKEDYIVVESKKFKLKIESTTLDLTEAKEEFADTFNVIVKNLINRKRLFKVFNYLGIKQQPVSKIIEEKTTELNRLNAEPKIKNVVKINNDEMMSTPFINFNRIEPSLHWQTNC